MAIVRRSRANLLFDERRAVAGIGECPIEDLRVEAGIVVRGQSTLTAIELLQPSAHVMVAEVD